MLSSEFILKFCQSLPEKPGIYKMLDEDGEILYVGKAKNLKKRVIYYSKEDLPTRLARMVFLVRNIQYIITKTEAEAFLLEAKQIKLHQPKFNILLKDDKSFPYIKLNLDHDFPSISKFRGKNNDKKSLFGPFASTVDLEKSLNLIKKIFKIRSCSNTYFSNRKRPCLQYQIKRCTAPCVQKINKQDYAESIKLAIDFLNGKNSTLQQVLSKKMDYYSENLEFEKAAEVRDNIKALTYIQTKAESLNVENDIDIVAIVSRNNIYCIQIFMYKSGTNYGATAYFPRHAEDATLEEVFSSFIGQYYQKMIPPKIILSNSTIQDKISVEEALYDLHKVKTKIISSKNQKYKEVFEHVLYNANQSLENHITSQAKNFSILQKLQDIFELDELPRRIEIYDNSHIMGKFAVGVMVVSGINGFEKNEYRKYTVENKNQYGGDDYEMLRQVLTRRIKAIKDDPDKKPSLMIIDGGKNHMKLACTLFEKHNLNLKFACMSKGEKRDAGDETFHIPNKNFTLSNRDEVMKFLQVLRDEAHRYAITSHKNKRAKSMSKSAIDEIPSIGSKRKKDLLNFFGSFEAIKEASINDFTKIKGISTNLAKKIFDFLHK